MMEGSYMTDFQYRSIIKTIRMLVHESKDIQEAERKLDEILGESSEDRKKKDD